MKPSFSAKYYACNQKLQIWENLEPNMELEETEEMNSLLTTQEIVDAINFVNEGSEEDELSEIVTYSQHMAFIDVNTHISSREIAEQYEGFASFISLGDSDGLLKFFRTNLPLMEVHTSDDPLLQGRSAVALLGSFCARAARAGGLPVSRCLEITQDYIKLANESINEEVVHFLMLPMMLELAKAVGAEAKSYTHPISHHAMTYVRSHLNESLDGDSVAEACGVSRKTLCTRFKQETGETFAHYVRRVRIERARRLLDTTDFEISRIAYQTGFSSQSHLQTMFKRETGYTPREWRMRENKAI